MEQKEFYSLEEVAKSFNRKRPTVYSRMKLIGMKGHKFKGDRKTYLSHEEVERLRDAFERPWTAGEKESEEESRENRKSQPAEEVA